MKKLVLNHVLQKLDIFVRLMKYFLRLSDFDIIFNSITSIRVKSLVDFVAKYFNAPEIEAKMEPLSYQFGASSCGSSGEVKCPF